MTGALGSQGSTCAAARVRLLPLPQGTHRAPPPAPRRPLSKTVRFNVLRVIPAGSAATKKGFSGF